MRIERHYTEGGLSPYSGLTWRAQMVPAHNLGAARLTEITETTSIEIPSDWSIEAGEALIDHAMRAVGVPARLRPVPEQDVPRFLWRHVADEPALAHLPVAAQTHAEQSAREIFDRIAGAWTYWGWRGGYFDREADAEAFHDELRFMLARQMIAPDLAQLAGTGLHWAYGIGKPDTEPRFVVDFQSGQTILAGPEHFDPHGAAIDTAPAGPTARPSASAGRGAAMALWQREARLREAGVSTGIDLSAMARQRGAAQGAIADQLRLAAGATAIDSAGPDQARAPTRAPARAIVLDDAHPDIETFLKAHAESDHRVAALATGAAIIDRHMRGIAAACRTADPKKALVPDRNPALKLALLAAREAMIPERYIARALALAAQGLDPAGTPIYDTDWDGPAQAAVGAGDGRHIARLGNDTLERVIATGGAASDLPIWRQVGLSAWGAGDSGVMFSSSAAQWNTCPADGEIGASAADGAYLFQGETQAGLAFVDVAKFTAEDAPYDCAGLTYTVRLAVIALDICAGVTAGVSPDFAAGTWHFRPLALSPTNFAGMLLDCATPYDSDEGRAMTGAVCALITGTAYAVSAEIAAELGACPAYAANGAAMHRVIANHRRAANGERGGYSHIAWAPLPLDRAMIADEALLRAARAAWADAARAGTEAGYRNAQVTGIAHDPTIARLLDCDAAGIAPLAGLTHQRAVAGGGFAKEVRPGIARALKRLGYGRAAISALLAHIAGHGSLRDSPALNHDALAARGLSQRAINAAEAALAHADDIRFVFNKWTLGEDACAALGLEGADFDDPGFDLLAAMGFGTRDIAAANAHVSGHGSLAGAPMFERRDAKIFACKETGPSAGAVGDWVSPGAEIRQMAAAQSFISGGVARLVTLREDASITACLEAYLLAWRLGLKGLALEREGARLSDPLSAPLFDVRLRDGHAGGDRAAMPRGNTDMPGRARGKFVVFDGGSGQGGDTARKTAHDTPRQHSHQNPHQGRHGDPRPPALQPAGPQGDHGGGPTAYSGGSATRAFTARALAPAREDQPSHENLRTNERGGPTRPCTVCGGFAPRTDGADAECGICGAVHGCHD